jgi:predicted enzyme related to lactoylglutathione lyase
MQGISWSTIALGSLLVISAYSKGRQEVQSPQPEKSKPPVKMEQSGRGRILGIGGVFFKSANREQMREWYSKHLGLADKGQGAMLPWREHDDPQKEHVTVWTVFPTSTKYFDPSPAPFMVNYIVDDMDALLDRLKQEGVKIDAKRMNESYGRFAWIYDLDGNKIELWQPLPAEGQKQSPQPEKSKPPVKMEQRERGRILGIGGVFFKSANREQMREWYSKHLGLADKGQGAMLPWREHDDPQKEHVTVWTVFSASTHYFDPSPAPFMVNYIVDDMDALLDRLKQEGVKIDAKRMNESYGRFAWIYDLDGNKIELWQPTPAKP